MPRTTTNLQFIIQRLRHIAANKKASPTTQVRALDRLAFIENLWTAQMKDQEPTSGEKPENLSGDGLDDTVRAMLDRATKKIGGANGAKLPESSS